MNTIYVSKSVAKQAKLATQTVRKSLKYLVDEGFAEASYNKERPQDMLRATIVVLPRESEHFEID